MNPYTVSVMPSFQLTRMQQMQAYYVVDFQKRDILVTSHLDADNYTSDRYTYYAVNGDLKSRKIISIAYCIADIYTCAGEAGREVDEDTMIAAISAFSRSLVGHVSVTYDLKDGDRTLHTFKDLEQASETFTRLTESIDKDYRIYEVRTYSHIESKRVI